MLYDGTNLEEVLACANTAQFKNAQLKDLDLSLKDLSHAEFIECTLDNVNLCQCDLSHAQFSNTIFMNTRMIKTHLRHVVIKDCVFEHVDATQSAFNFASIIGSQFFDCVFKGADLRMVFARECDFDNSDFRRSIANCSEFSMSSFNNSKMSGMAVSNTGFNGVHLSGTSREELHIPMACPDEGSFIGWKKCRLHDTFTNRYISDDDVHVRRPCIVKLLIPEDALRLSAAGRKCRASKAKVLDIQTLEGKSLKDAIALSDYNPDFTYTVGEVVESVSFDGDRWWECSSGIHFFINRQEAVNYGF